MTRLTTNDIHDLFRSLSERDADLRRKTGLTLKGLALSAVGHAQDGLDLGQFRVAAVPVDSGQGIIPEFSRSVCSIVRHMGMDGFVTAKGDVAGIAEAMAGGADIVFLADDDEFIALNLRAGRFADNTRSTALGYCAALEAALGGLTGRDVLVIGAGRVGSYAIPHLQARGAKVSLLEQDRDRAVEASRRFGVALVLDARHGISQAKAILNASPAPVPGGWICEDAVISSPGVPYAFDEEGERRAMAIIHDPLQIGVAVMAAWSAGMSYHAIGGPQQAPAEVLE
ncbi:MAG: 3-methylornithyl-N6-L-lysine dehydrogenase PylD [Methanomassiliicoccus sp.]|nr:3-methylornithyl-N6-L-lysine dehydrogenase PylD [Methanomassiliicoccus sp.]